jgi:ubiquinone/menaquinone biosynthesis C-methylase UbiE
VNIELGPGHAPSLGHLGIDIDIEVGPMIVGSVTDLPLRDGVADSLLALDVLEHVPYARAESTMAEWVRVLAPGGPLTLRVPDTESEMRRVLAEPVADMARLNLHLLGMPEIPFQGHQTLYSEDSLRALLVGAGLRVIQVTRDLHPNLIAVAQKR